MAKVAYSLDSNYNSLVDAWRSAAKKDGLVIAELLVDFGVRFSYNSGRIENTLISYHDTRDVFENGHAVAYSGDVRTLFEIQNLKTSYELMLKKLEKKNPITEKLVLEFHEVLTQGTYDERRWSLGERPGQYKKQDYVVGAHDAGLPAAKVGAALRSLCTELKAATPENVLTVAAYFHAQFENIHPFSDGNGRCGRALTNYLLLLNEHPPIIVFDEDKLAYYGALDAFDTEADLDPMLEFLKAETIKTWSKSLSV
ncbi:MAG: Fic family protein [Eggerthellaceae bacterium]|nr:Fic family protein [Eggerthellaceae bacterium]